MQNRSQLGGTLVVAIIAGLATGLLVGCTTVTEERADSSATGSPRSFAILSINDVYRIEGLQSGEGGLARLRTLRKTLEQDYPDLLLLHGGDVLYPSLLSRLLDGRQMIDVLNQLDGLDPGFDPRMFVVFGNHEFDEERIRDWGMLNQRVADSDFRWLAANLDFKTGYDLTSNNVSDNVLIESGGVTVGIFGLMIDTPEVEYARPDASLERLRYHAIDQSRRLRAQGAEVVVGLTHLTRGDDIELLKLEGGPDLIIGGHDHENMSVKVNGRCLLKADADAKTARLVVVTTQGSGPPRVENRLVPVDSTIPADSDVQASVDRWLADHAAAYCAKKSQPDDCLSMRLGTSTTALVGEEIAIRNQETSLGNWVADEMLKAGRAHGKLPDDALVASLINSGALRLNQNLPPGADLSRQVLEELIQYDDPLYLFAVSTAELQTALDHSVASAGEGPWLQVAGLRFEADMAAGKAGNVSVGGVPVEDVSDGKLFLVTNRFIADPGAPGNQDGYAFTATEADRVHDGAGNEVMLKAVIEEALTNAPNQTIAPTVEGRVTMVNAPAQASLPECDLLP